jgi:hypothetical protein
MVIAAWFQECDAPAESSNTQLAPGIHQAPTECGWKGWRQLIGGILGYLGRSALDCFYYPLSMWDSIGSHSLYFSRKIVLHARDFGLGTVDQKIARTMIAIERLSDTPRIGHDRKTQSGSGRSRMTARRQETPQESSSVLYG